MSSCICLIYNCSSFQKGDIFFLHNDLGDGWLWVTAHRTGEQGLIFRDLVEDLDDTIDPNSVFQWFHSSVTKDEAVDMLVKGIIFDRLLHMDYAFINVNVHLDVFQLVLAASWFALAIIRPGITLCFFTLITRSSGFELKRRGFDI